MKPMQLPLSSWPVATVASSLSASGRRSGHLTFKTRPVGGSAVVEIGANRKSCEPSTMLLFKLVLEVVLSGPLASMKSSDQRILRSNKN